MKKQKKIKVGVFGARRGASMMSVMSQHPEAALAAICDYSEPALKKCAERVRKNGAKVTYYRDFDKFLNHDLDAVILANYATEHAPYAVRALNSVRHVCSEVTACQNLAEAVELVEAVERSRKVYTFAENYCYFRGTLEMQRLYRAGEIGEFLHAEGEYVHDCESIWASITGGQRNHWRNWVPSTFYCTHSIGPIVTITGTRPVRVTAYETPNINKRRFGCRSADGAVILCQMSNGGSDFYTMHYFLQKIQGRPEGKHAIDVYQALDMTLPGLLGYRSILNGNMPFDVPDFRNKQIREKYWTDHWCCDPKLAGEGRPKYNWSGGEVKVPESVYRKQQKECPR